MRFRWRDLLAVVGLSARARPLAASELPTDPELAAVRGKRIELEATVDLLRLEAANLGVDEEERRADTPRSPGA